MNIRRAICSAFTAIAVGATFSALAADPVKIALVAELSGPSAALGQDKLDAFNMVVEENGGKLGGIPVKVLARDSQLKPEVANQIAEELIEKEKVPIVTGLSFSNIMMVMARKLDAANIITVGAGAGPAPLAGQRCLSNVFVVSKQNDQFAEAMGQYANKQGYKKVIAMAPNYQAGKDFVSGFKRTYDNELVDEIYTPLNQLDFSAELARVKSENPDALYVFYPGSLGVSFVRAYKQLGMIDKVPLLSVSTVDGTTLPALKDNALGVMHASSWGPDLDNSANQKFVADFEKKYNRIPSEYAAQSYDAAQLIASALAKTNGDVEDREAFKKALAEADFDSVRGELSFNTNQFPIQDFYAFKVVKDKDGNVTLKTVDKVLKQSKDSYYQDCKLG